MGVRSANRLVSNEELLSVALKTVTIEEKTLRLLYEALPRSDFISVVRAVYEGVPPGKVVLTGVGKSALIAQKISATLSSTGTPAVFMHAADALHGDLGMVTPRDIVFVLSKSGNTPEIRALVPNLKHFGVVLVAVTSNSESYLARQATYRIVFPVPEEACPNNLAPTASTTAQLVVGDALAMALAHLYGFSAEDFARLHPGGTLGKKLYLRVSDLYPQNPRPWVWRRALISEVIVAITSGRVGAVAVLEEGSRQLVGIITDGDIRRMLQHYSVDQLGRLRAEDVMSSPPKVISSEALAVEALDKMRRHKINQLIVVDPEDEKKYLGIIHMHDLVREGLV